MAKGKIKTYNSVMCLVNHFLRRSHSIKLFRYEIVFTPGQVGELVDNEWD